MLGLLLGAVESEEECRNVVAECLGRLALLHPGIVLPALLERTTAPSANMRAVVRHFAHVWAVGQCDPLSSVPFWHVERYDGLR